MDLLIGEGFTKSELLFTLYSAPVIALFLQIAMNYIFGAIGVYVLLKRYKTADPKLAWYPFLRYYYLGKLVFDRPELKNRAWLAVGYPVAYAFSCVSKGVSLLVTAVFSYNVNLDIMNYYQSGGENWQADFEACFLPKWLNAVGIVGEIAGLLAFVFGMMLLYRFFLKFKTNSAVGMTVITGLLMELNGIFIFVCRNNKSFEEMQQTFGQYGFSGYDPYRQNSYGAYQNPNSNPYGNPYRNPYGNQNADPYGSNPYQAPNGGPKDPYAESEPKQEPKPAQNESPFADLEDNFGKGKKEDENDPFSDKYDPFQ